MTELCREEAQLKRSTAALIPLLSSLTRRRSEEISSPCLGENAPFIPSLLSFISPLLRRAPSIHAPHPPPPPKPVRWRKHCLWELQ